MKTTIIKICVLFIFIITFNGCVFTTCGDSLAAFSNRMNEIDEQYNMTVQGYIIDRKEQTFTKFFNFAAKEIMLNFKYDHKFRLTEMNLVFDSGIPEEDQTALKFIEDCITCFCRNANVKDALLESTSFYTAITKTNKETISAETDNIRIEIDTTQLGTVVTVYKTI